MIFTFSNSSDLKQIKYHLILLLYYAILILGRGWIPPWDSAKMFCQFFLDFSMCFSYVFFLCIFLMYFSYVFFLCIFYLAVLRNTYIRAGLDTPLRQCKNVLSNFLGLFYVFVLCILYLVCPGGYGAGF